MANPTDFAETTNSHPEIHDCRARLGLRKSTHARLLEDEARLIKDKDLAARHPAGVLKPLFGIEPWTQERESELKRVRRMLAISQRDVDEGTYELQDLLKVCPPRVTFLPTFRIEAGVVRHRKLTPSKFPGAIHFGPPAPPVPPPVHPRLMTAVAATVMPRRQRPRQRHSTQRCRLQGHKTVVPGTLNDIPDMASLSAPLCCSRSREPIAHMRCRVARKWVLPALRGGVHPQRWLSDKNLGARRVGLARWGLQDKAGGAHTLPTHSTTRPRTYSVSDSHRRLTIQSAPPLVCLPSCLAVFCCRLNYCYV